MEQTDTISPGTIPSANRAVAALRASLGETGEQFGQRIGLSKSKVSELENGRFRPSAKVAVTLEELSGGQIDAADLCDDVRVARHGLGVSTEMAETSPGKSGENSQGADSAANQEAA